MTLTGLVLVALLQSGLPGNFILYFDHDGLETTSYVMVVDGVDVPITTTCTGTGDTRHCTAPITLTMNVKHAVTVAAIGTFGRTGSIPFTCDVPKAPTGVNVTK